MAILAQRLVNAGLAAVVLLPVVVSLWLVSWPSHVNEPCPIVAPLLRVFPGYCGVVQIAFRPFDQRVLPTSPEVSSNKRGACPMYPQDKSVARCNSKKWNEAVPTVTAHTVRGGAPSAKQGGAVAVPGWHLWCRVRSHGPAHPDRPALLRQEALRPGPTQEGPTQDVSQSVSQSVLPSVICRA